LHLIYNIDDDFTYTCVCVCVCVCTQSVTKTPATEIKVLTVHFLITMSFKGRPITRWYD